jgi:two-component system, LytTR family, sensor kinase
MVEGVSLRNPLFVNTVGNISGALLFGLLIILLVRGWARSQDRQRSASLIAACLAFIWNLGSLVGVASTHQDGQIADWLVTINFSVLSLLPAVLFKVVLRQRYPFLARVGYALAFSSVALHFAELRFPWAGLHEIALLLITVGFACLIAAVYVVSYLRSDARPSLTDAVCLLLFTLSFLHFGYGHSTAAWTNEVACHHAGIPLALIVLLRDYRLLLLETFIRFLANFGLAGAYALALYWTNKGGNLLERARGNGFALGILLISFCFSLILFTYLRSLLQKQLTHRVFRRGDLNACSKRILQISSESRSEQELLSRVAAELCRFVNAERFLVSDKPVGQAQSADLAESKIAPDQIPADYFWAELELPLRFSRGDSVTLLLGPRRGSRRYLPEDIEALTQLTALLTEQVERFRHNELQRLAHEAEVRALQAQINPHFLFNALNTLYGTIGRESFQARRLVLNLADLFRYCLQRDRTLIPLGEELSIVQAYLEIETLRLGDRLVTEICAVQSAREVMIPILTVQPLVENAIKHGISQRTGKGKIRVLATNSGGVLLVTVQDNGPGFAQRDANSGLGMGLENVRQRLRLCYGASATVNINSTRDRTSVSLSIPIGAPEDVAQLAPKSARARPAVSPTTAGTRF